MAHFLIRRVLGIIPTLLGLLTLVFFLIRLVPGDPAVAMLGPHATAEAIQDVRHSLGLDRPTAQQYVLFVARAVTGDLGRSLASRRPVIQELVGLLPPTLNLAAAGMLLAVIWGVPFGVLAGVRRNSWVDGLSRVISLLGVSLPVFFLGLLLLMLFSYKLKWFPVIGAGDQRSLLSSLHHLVLPAVSVGIYMAALIGRMTRSCILEVLQEDYVRTARAKGLRESAVIYRHVLRNAFNPVLTVIGISLGQLLGGAILTETLFARPGLGKLLMEAISARDYPVVQGTVLVFATGVVVVNLLVDILYGVVDPRISYQ